MPEFAGGGERLGSVKCEESDNEGELHAGHFSSGTSKLSISLAYACHTLPPWSSDTVFLNGCRCCNGLND